MTQAFDHVDFKGQMPPEYDFLRPLGAGGCGFVCLARQRSTGREVALKLLHGERMGDERSVRRFEREARIMAGLHHGNVIEVFDFGQGPTGPYLALEYLAGGNLGERVRADGAVAPGKALTWTAQILSALEALHDDGVVHRDVKPENVFLSDQEEVKLGDLGLATGESVTRMTRTGALVGTPRYLAPEILRGDRASKASDLYAVGVTLWFLLQGKLPFADAANFTELLAKILMGADELPEDCPGDEALPAWPAIRAFVSSLLAPVPELRPSSARQARRRCEELRDGLHRSHELNPSSHPLAPTSEEGRDTLPLPRKTAPTRKDSSRSGAGPSRSDTDPSGGGELTRPPAKRTGFCTIRPSRRRIWIGALFLTVLAAALFFLFRLAAPEVETATQRMERTIAALTRTPPHVVRDETGSLRCSFLTSDAIVAELHLRLSSGKSMVGSTAPGYHHVIELPLSLFDKIQDLHLALELAKDRGVHRSLRLEVPADPSDALEAFCKASEALPTHRWLLSRHEMATKAGEKRPRPGKATWEEARSRYRRSVHQLELHGRWKAARPWLHRVVESPDMPLPWRWRCLSALQALQLLDRNSWVGADGAELALAHRPWTHARPWKRGSTVLRRLARRRQRGLAPGELHLQLQHNDRKDSLYWCQESEIRGELRAFWETVTTAAGTPSVYHREQRGQFTIREDAPWRSALSFVLVTWQLAPNMVFKVHLEHGRGYSMDLLLGRCIVDGKGRKAEVADSRGRYGSDLRLDLPAAILPPGRYSYRTTLHKFYDEGAWENSALSRIVLAGPFGD